jgi:hypothetical protein
MVRWHGQSRAHRPLTRGARSPNGSLLMTKLGRGMKIWTQDGVCKKTIDRRTSVQSVTWLEDGEGVAGAWTLGRG